MSESEKYINPLDLLGEALLKRARGEDLSAAEIAHIINMVSLSPLGQCRNAQALLAALSNGESYREAIKRTDNSSYGYED